MFGTTTVAVEYPNCSAFPNWTSPAILLSGILRIDSDKWSRHEVARLLTFLEEEKRFFQDVLAALPVAVAVVSESKVIASNRAFRSEVGWSEAVPAEAAEAIAAALGRAAGRPWRWKGNLVTIAPFRDPLSDAPAVLLTFEREQEEARAPADDESGAALAADCQARIAVLEAIGRLSNRLAHILERALAEIAGRAETLAGPAAGGSPQDAAVRRILQAAGAASVVVEKLARWGTPPAARPELFDLNELLRRTAVGAVLELSPEPVFVSADRAQLTGALRSLAEWTADRLGAGGKLTMRTGMRAIAGEPVGVLPAGFYVSLEMGPLGELGEAEIEPWLDPLADSPGGEGPDMTAAAQALVGMNGHLWIEHGAGGQQVVILLPQAGRAAPKP